MSRSLIITGLVICAAIASCKPNSYETPVQKDRFVKFTSHLGTSFVAPSQFTTTDEGDTFSLKSSDGHVAIHAIVYTSEGSGSLQDFQATMTTALLPEGASHWQDSKWSTIKLGNFEASKRELVPVPKGDQLWRLYVVDGGKYYHAIILSGSTIVIELNGEFYENIVRTFDGLRE